jgi:putative toxin-antitoxin system antitoxin component (TIGR02293 family)
MGREQSKGAKTANETTLALRRKQIQSLAVQIWADSAEAKLWLDQPHLELGGASPNSLMKTARGIRTVEALLAALDSGFPV